jgi:hypothetical protein
VLVWEIGGFVMATSRVSITAAFSEAWERMTSILFRPFDLGKWLALGFTAWLASLIGNGGGGGGGSSWNMDGASNAPDDLVHSARIGCSWTGVRSGAAVGQAQGTAVPISTQPAKFRALAHPRAGRGLRHLPASLDSLDQKQTTLLG